MGAQQGLVHIYTGTGKGKTTAAVGLCVRALGAGKRVYFTQFLKDGSSAEISQLRALGATVDIPPQQAKFFAAMTEAEKERCRTAQQRALAGAVAAAADYDLVVCDEIMAALALGTVKLNQVCALIDGRAPGCELVLTGRGAPAELVERCDYLSDIQCKKHPYEQGIAARRGIEY